MSAYYFPYCPIGLRLLEYCLMDVIFVAIDFENVYAICGKGYTQSRHVKIPGSIHNTQAGIAILDTRDLRNPPESAVTTRQFCTGFKWYCDVVPTRLISGNSETHTLETLRTRLTEILCFTDPITKKYCPIVILGHTLMPNGDEGDIACLNRLTDPSYDLRLSIIST